MNQLKLATLNVRGLHGDKRHPIFRHLSDIKQMLSFYRRHIVLNHLLKFLTKDGVVKLYTM